MLLRRVCLATGLVAAVWLLAVSSASAEALRLPAVLSDHMVLQREARVPVWGWAEPGATVVVRFKGQAHRARAGEDGRWRVDLDPMEADAAPATLTVSSGERALAVDDVLVGEVWLCGGQSNMAWPMSRADDAEREIARADWPQIRHLRAPKNPRPHPQDDLDAQWTVCSPTTAPRYTAVGYYFARRLHEELGVPIGLLNCSWGGTRIEPWIPIEGYAATPELEATYRTLTDHPLPDEPGRQDPTALYNGMIAPIVPFAIRGAIWYQGEASRRDGMAYVDKTRALVAGWRAAWNMPQMPYYFVQISPYQYRYDDPELLPRFWEAQAAITDAISHTGMVVISDVGDIDDLHPTNKRDVGIRLANLALKHDYGRDGLVAHSPRLRHMRIDGQTVRLTFDRVGDGLRARDGRPLDWFELAGAHHPWTPATARIVAADAVELIARGVPDPVGARLGWHKHAQPNLVNSAGLPAEPFRTGREPEVPSLADRVPESSDYELVYALDLNRFLRDGRFDVDRQGAISRPFDRVAYYLELHDPDGEARWAYVSMDAFTDDLAQITVHAGEGGEGVRHDVSRVSVRSNVPTLPHADGLTGRVEFDPSRSLRVVLREPGVRVMALHGLDRGEAAAIGIGTGPALGDAALSSPAPAKRYTVKRLLVLVHLNR